MKPNHKRNIGYTFGSLLLFIHALLLILLPAPKSIIRDNISKPANAYISFFHLDNGWNFYAPNPSFDGALIKITIRAHDGTAHQYQTVEDKSKFDINYFRYSTLNSVMVYYHNPRLLQDYVQYICRKYRHLKPRAIEIQKIVETKLSPQDYLAGIRPLHPDYIRVYPYQNILCQDNS